MSNLAKIETKIKSIDSKKLIIEIAKIINYCYALKGYKIDENGEQLLFESQQLTEIISKEFSSFSLEKISEILKNGILGKYCKYTVLSVSTFYDFLKGYIDSADYINEQRQQLTADEPINQLPSHIPTSDEVGKENLLIWFERYKSKEHFIALSRLTELSYNYLRKNRKLLLSDEEKSKIIEQAKRLIISKEESKRFNAKNGHEARGISELIKKLHEQDQSVEQLIYAEAQKIAIENWFDGLIEMEVELTDIIEN